MPHVADPGGLDPPGWDDLPASIRTRVLKVMSAWSGRPPERLGPDLGIVQVDAEDSLDTIELLLRFEEEFGLAIPDEDAERITTLEQAAQYFAARAAEGRNDDAGWI